MAIQKRVIRRNNTVKTDVAMRKTIEAIQKSENTKEMLDIIQVLHPGFDPVLNMIKLAKEFEDKGDRKAAFEINKEIATYVYPKKRSVEHTGNKKEDPIQVNIINYSGAKKDAIDAEVVITPRTNAMGDDSES